MTISPSPSFASTTIESISTGVTPLKTKKDNKFYAWIDFIKLYLISFLLVALKAYGYIPSHVGIIMDGNRRYAKKKHLSKLSSGHFEGAKTLEKMLDYGYRLGIKTVTVYAFSIENFKRPAEEVDILMSLAAEKLYILSQKSEMIKKNEVKINVLGAVDMLPKHVQIAAAEAMKSTINHEKFILNICFPYTSSHEIESACKLAVDLVVESGSDTHLDGLECFDCLLDTWESPPLDILIRTSGEARLSEFLLWQVCRRAKLPVQIEILDILWPEFEFRHLLRIILKFQRLRESRAFESLAEKEEITKLKQLRRSRKLDQLQEIL